MTTVRNLGSFGFADIVMRDLINMGAMVGPRMFVSGPALRNNSALGVAVPEATADGPLEVTVVVRRLIASGVDTIKVFGSTRAGPAPQDMSQTLAVWGGSYAAFTYDELKAAVDTAHSLGKTVAVPFIRARWCARRCASRRCVRAGSASSLPVASAILRPSSGLEGLV